MKTHELYLKAIFFCIGLVLSSPLFAQRLIDRPASSFDEVVAFGNVEVFLSEGDDFEIKVRAINIESEKVSTEVSGGKLTIKLQSIKKEEYAKIYVTAPLYREVRAQAGARISSETLLSGDKLYTSAMAGAQVDLKIEVNEVEGKASEGGTLRLWGSAATLDASAASGGEVESLELKAKNVYVKALVGGTARVAVEGRLEASAKAGGKVIFAGEPTSQSITTALGGTVVPMDN